MTDRRDLLIHRSMGLLSGTMGVMAFASSLGAPQVPLPAMAQRLSLAATGIWVFSVPPPARPLPKAPPKVRPRRPRPPPAPKVVAAPVLEDETASAWDPETAYERIEVGRCRALLLEVIRRAIHDWILYRGHSKIELRARAESAFIWLFLEAPGHAWWASRAQDGHTITSFLAICEALDLDPDFVRRRARETTVKQIMTAGRPAERRRARREVSYEEHGVDDSSIDVKSLDALDAPRGSMSAYEAHFAAYTPDYM